MPQIEARLIIPTRPNKGSYILADQYHMALVKLERRLVTTFGGYTKTEGIGAWKAPHESIVRERVRIYLFAYDSHNIDHFEEMERLPAEMRIIFDQEAIYLSRTQLQGQPVHYAPREGSE